MADIYQRKEPKQQRARTRIQHILQATAELIEINGLEALTTNHVAERANVNIASIYQYFPNKEALILALLESHLQEMSKMLHQVLQMQQTLSIADSTNLWCMAALAYFRARPELLQIVLRWQQQPRELSSAKMLEYRLMEAMRRFLAPRRMQLAPPDLELAIEVAFTTCSAMLARHLLNPQPYYSDEVIAAELSRLMVGYFGVMVK